MKNYFTHFVDNGTIIRNDYTSSTFHYYFKGDKYSQNGLNFIIENIDTLILNDMSIKFIYLKQI